MLKYGSVCSGVEAASLAWEPLGWSPQFFSEIEAFPSAVLAHRWPDVPNLGDFTTVDGTGWRGRVDVLVAGTPCQAFSVAGMRGSLGDARGNLTLAFVELVHAADPWCVVWENVPGVLSTADNAFGCFLAGLVGADHPLDLPAGQRWTDAGMVTGPIRSAAWRILDAQYFGVPQRRRRVFVVSFRTRDGINPGAVRDGINPGAVLFEPASVRRDSSASREARQDLARCLTGGSGGGCRLDGESDTFVTGTLRAGSGGGCRPGVDQAATGQLVLTLRGEGFDASEDGSGRGTPIIADTVRSHPRPGSNSVGNLAPLIAPCLTGNYGKQPDNSDTSAGPCLVVTDSPLAVQEDNQNGVTMRETAGSLRSDAPGHQPCGTLVFDTTQITSPDNRSQPQAGGPCHPLAAGAHHPALAFHNRQDPNSGERTHALGAKDNGLGVASSGAVRRLTPRECERLQGMPDDHTLVPWRGGIAPDSPRYRAIGNSMAVPCMRWIGERIQALASATGGLSNATS